MRFSLKAILLSLLIPVLFPLTSLASEIGVTQDEFLERYTKAVDDYNTSYATEEGLQEKKTIKKEQLFITRYSPNNVLEIIINGASAFKDPMGNMILLTDDMTQFSNSEITLDVAMALYAFDPSFQEVRQATQLYVDLSHSKTGTITHGDVDYTILNQNGNMLQIEAVYRGYTPILGITPTPSPEDEAADSEETDAETEDTETEDTEAADAETQDTEEADASDAADTESEESSSGQDAGTAEDASDQDAGAAEAAPTPTPVASVLVYPGGAPSSDSGTETSSDTDGEDSSDTEGSQNEDAEASSDSDAEDSQEPGDEVSGNSDAEDSRQPDDEASGDSDADDSQEPEDEASGDSDKSDTKATPTPTPKITITPGITALPTLTPSVTPTPRPTVKPPMAARPSVTPVPSPLPPRRQ